MASIANLAAKVSANIGNLTSTLKSVTSSIDNIARSAAKSSPTTEKTGLLILSDGFKKTPAMVFFCKDFQRWAGQRTMGILW